MAIKLANDPLRRAAIVAAVGILHLLLLCAPVALVGQRAQIAKNPRILAFLVVVGVWHFVESMAAPAGARLPMKSHGPQRLPLAIGVLLPITFWVSLTDTATSVPAPFGTAAVAGTLLMVAGIALRYLSIRTLGRFFLNEVALVPGQPLVTHGIYGRLRHPSELGTVCLAFGGVIVLGSVFGVTAGTLLLLPCLIWRTRLEDRMLRDHYAMEFARYAADVPALLPRIRPARQNREKAPALNG